MARCARQAAALAAELGSALEVELSAAKSAIALEERLAKLDKAVFGDEPTSRLNAPSVPEAIKSKCVRQMRAVAFNSLTFEDLTALLPSAVFTAEFGNAPKFGTSHNLYYVK